MPRRGFVKTCLATATMVAASPSLLARAEPLRRYNRILLVDESGSPLGWEALASGAAFVFHYPYVTTPCFLLDIGRRLEGGRSLQTAGGDQYQWQGGTGPRGSIVAFSAICAHKLSYPTRTISFLNYRPGTMRFENTEGVEEERRQVIFCCSERSAYDPAQGAAVMGGPARQPLASIELEYDAAADRFFALGTRGGELFDAFFRRFGFRLALDHGIEDVRELTSESAEVIPHERYSSQPVSC